MWGLGLSGTLQGAGGVSGVLTISNRNAGFLLPICDANGNITDLVDEIGCRASRYQYNAYGKILAQDNSYSVFATLLFSTEYSDAETGFYYYGYRFYSADCGRWLSRDPVQSVVELGLFQYEIQSVHYRILLADIIPYHFVFNNPLNRIDIHGLLDSSDDGVDPCECFSLQFYIAYWSFLRLSSIDMEPFPGVHQPPVSPDWALKYRIIKSKEKCCVNQNSAQVKMKYTRYGIIYSRTHNHRWDVDPGYQWSVMDGIVYPDPTLGIVSDQFDSGTKIHIDLLVGDTICEQTEFEVK